MKLSYRKVQVHVYMYSKYNSQNLYNFTVCGLSRTLLLRRVLLSVPH